LPPGEFQSRTLSRARTRARACTYTHLPIYLGALVPTRDGTFHRPSRARTTFNLSTPCWAGRDCGAHAALCPHHVYRTGHPLARPAFDATRPRLQATARTGPLRPALCSQRDALRCCQNLLACATTLAPLPTRWPVKFAWLECMRMPRPMPTSAHRPGRCLQSRRALRRLCPRPQPTHPRRSREHLALIAACTPRSSRPTAGGMESGPPSSISHPARLACRSSSAPAQPACWPRPVRPPPQQASLA
jgi:hypothetical protein